jgi:hypothetical protein
MNEELKQRYPLQWPNGYQRSQDRINSSFKQTMGRAQKFLLDEVERLKAKDLIVSTNLRVRNDGGLYADDMDKVIPDPGVAIYFKYKGKEISMCCDQYKRVWENIYALAKGIEALRGMDRWGVSDFLDRAFTGFAALPAARVTLWFEVLGFKIEPAYDDAKKNYYELAKKFHPDANGGIETYQFTQLGKAWSEAKKYFGV